MASSSGEVGMSVLQYGVSPELLAMNKMLGEVNLARLGLMVGKIAISASVTAAKYVLSHGLRGVTNFFKSGWSMAKSAWNWVTRKRGCGCFTPATLVWTMTGLVPIDQVKIGDYVVARDDQTGLVQFAPVEATMVTPGAALVEVTVEHSDGRLEVIQTTDEHPFWVDTKTGTTAETATRTTAAPTLRTGLWRRVDELVPGSRISTLMGPAAVLGVTFTNERQTVYNLSVKNIGTFHVGADGVLVHNCPPFDAKRDYWKPKHGWSGPPQARVILLNINSGERVTKVVSKDVHHRQGRFWGGSNDLDNLEELWPWEHAGIDPDRAKSFPYVLLQVLEFIPPRKW